VLDLKGHFMRFVSENLFNMFCLFKYLQ